MAYAEARYQDRLGLFVDAVYANLTAGTSATRGFPLPGISGSAVATASVNYELLTLQFGAAYEVARVGPDRGAEGPRMAGVGQTAFDVVVGWTVVVPAGRHDPELQWRRHRQHAQPFGLRQPQPGLRQLGSIGWVDPLVGFRVRHRLAPGENLTLEADIGSFGIGSRISAEAQLAYGVEFGDALGVNWAGVLGYRALYVDYTQGSGSSLFEMNMLQHGPLLGVRGRF